MKPCLTKGTVYHDFKILCISVATVLSRDLKS